MASSLAPWLDAEELPSPESERVPLSSSRSLTVAGRSPRGAPRAPAAPVARLRWLGAAALAACLLLAALAPRLPGLPGPGGAPPAAGPAAGGGLVEAAEERAAQFGQCNGNGIVKPCEAGCLCTFKNDFFWFCKPVPGQSTCNAAAAQDLLDGAEAKAKPLREEQQSTAKLKNETAAHFLETVSTLESATKKAAETAKERNRTAEAATMEAVKADHAKTTENAKGKVKKAEAARVEAVDAAKAQAAKDVADAEAAVKKAEEVLAQRKEAAMQEVKERVKKARERVAEAKAARQRVSSQSLDPILAERRKAVAPADESAGEKEGRAREAFRSRREAQEADRKARREAQRAEEALEATQEDLRKWERALV